MAKARVFLRWAAAAAILMLLLLLAWQCVDIYRAGTAHVDEKGTLLQSVYTRADVTARLKTLSVPIFAGLAIIVAACAAHAGRPCEAKKNGMSAANRLRLIRGQVETLPAEAKREEKRRIGVYTGCGTVLAVCGLFMLLYLLDGQHFTSWDLESVMGDTVKHIAPWTALGLAAVYAAGVLRDSSMHRECEILRRTELKAHPSVEQKREKGVPVLRTCLLGVAVLFIVLGVMNGGLYDVLVKAINICTECIGLG